MPLDVRMDEGKTASFDLGEGEAACLLLHGFTGSPWDIRPLGEYLAARGFRAKGIRLPGHGQTPRDMGRAGRAEWLGAASEALASLASCRHLFIAGLSMGAMLALVLASKESRVKGLALLAPAQKFQDRRMRVLRRLRALPLMPLLPPFVLKDATDIGDAEVRKEAPLLAAFPTSRLHDLWAVQDEANRCAKAVGVPVLALAAPFDGVVSTRGVKQLCKRLSSSPEVRFVELQKGCHIIPRDSGAVEALPLVCDFFRGLCR